MQTLWIRHPVFALVWLGLTLIAMLPLTAWAQSEQLRVTLRDLDGQAVANIAVIVRSEEGDELVRQSTGAEGEASFTGLPDVVRVAVDGQPRGRPRLYQLGDDARGVRVDLAWTERDVTLDLRIEQDGLVLPDPATMLSLETGGPIVSNEPPVATAQLATPAPLPSSTVALADNDTQVVAVAGAQEQRSGERWAPVATLLIVVAALVVMLVIQRRRAAL